MTLSVNVDSWGLSKPRASPCIVPDVLPDMMEKKTSDMSLARLGSLGLLPQKCQKNTAHMKEYGLEVF